MAKKKKQLGGYVYPVNYVPKAQRGIASSDNTSVRKSAPMLTMAEYQKQQEEANKQRLAQKAAQQAASNAATMQSPSSLPKMSRQQVYDLNKQYARQYGKSFNSKTGDVEPVVSDNVGRMMDRAMENIVEPMLDIEMVMSGAPLLGQGLKATGKFLTEQTALKNAYKINPWAFKANPASSYNIGSRLGNLLNTTINPLGILSDYGYGFLKGGAEQSAGLLRELGILKGNAPRRPFFETFPITKAQKAKVSAMQDEAFDDARKFTQQYWYGNNTTMRPVLEEKIREILPNIKLAKNIDNLEFFNSPFSKTKEQLIPSTTWGKGREGLSDEIIKYLNTNRGRLGGVNDGEVSLTLRNRGLYYLPPKDIANIVAHEAGHTAQKFGYFGEPPTKSGPYDLFSLEKVKWSDQVDKYDPKYNYFTSNPDTELGQRFQKALVEPKNDKLNNSFTTQTWRSSPNELHSELMASKYNLYKKGISEGFTPEEMIEKVTNPGDKELEWLLKNKSINKHFKKGTPLREKLDLLKILPATVPAIAGAASAVDQKKNGGWLDEFDVPEAQVGEKIKDYVKKPVKAIEKKLLDEYVYPAVKESFKTAKAQGLSGEHNGPLDAIRHATSAATVSSILPSWMNFIPQVGIANFVGSNLLGAAHEITSPNPIREIKSDVYNNIIGSGIGMLPISDSQKRKLIIDAQKKGILSTLESKQDGGGVESTMDGLTDKGFDYNGAWGGPSMQMGGSMPGSVGFTYARTEDPAPSKGNYAKKTMASAQDGEKVEYKELPEIVVVGGKDKPTIDLYRKELDKLQSSENNPYYGADEYGKYYAKMQIAKQFGVPKIRPQEPIGQFGSFFRNRSGIKTDPNEPWSQYDPFTKTVYADFDHFNYLNQYIPELSHYVSQKEGALGHAKRGAYDLMQYALGNDPYDTKGGEEYHAHREIEPVITDRYYDLRAEGEKKYKEAAYNSIRRNLYEKDKKLLTLVDNLQNGGEMKFYQEGLDWTPKNISRDGSEIPQAQIGIATGDIASLPGVRKEIPLSKEELAKNKKAVEERVKAENAKIVADRKARIKASEEAKKKPMSAKTLAEQTQATGDKFRLFPNDPNSFIDDYLNPGVMIGNMASGLGKLPYDLQQGNYGQAAWNVALPLATGALAGIGASNTKQFVNNLVNPLAGIGTPKTSAISSSVDNVVDNVVNTGKNWGKEYFEKIQSKEKELQDLVHRKKITVDDYLKQTKAYRKEVQQSLGLNNYLGGGNYGQVFELGDDASKVIKLGTPFFEGVSYARPWTSELIENLKNIKQNYNIAIPEKVDYFKLPSLYKNYTPRTKEVIIMPNLNKTGAENLGLNKRDRYAYFLKQARQLRDKGIMLDVDNYQNINFNKDKGVFDIFDVNPGEIYDPVAYMQYVRNKTVGPLFNHMHYKKGGQIKKDNMGYWNPENWGKPVEIGSNEITMQGVDQPLIGISDTGDVQMMYPGEDYTFDGDTVTEYPVAQKGYKTLPSVNIKKEPIYVDDPNDPRLKSYQDSLYNYNRTEAFRKLMNSADKIPVEQFMKNKEAFSKKYDKGVTRNMEPVGYEKHSHGPMMPVYKKPAQPVKYKTPEQAENKKSVDKVIIGDEKDFQRYNNESPLIKDKDGVYRNDIGISFKFKPKPKPVQQKVEPKKPESSTLYVDDVNDPRLRAYNDSLNLYNNYPIPLNKESYMLKSNTYPSWFDAQVKRFTKNGNKPVAFNLEKVDKKGYHTPIHKKPEQRVEYRKPQPKKEEPAKKQEQPVEVKKNIYEGTPVYSSPVGSGFPSAVIGFANQRGEITYIKPEDYERFGVPKYGKEYIESKTTNKKKNGGWLDEFE